MCVFFRPRNLKDGFLTSLLGGVGVSFLPSVSTFSDAALDKRAMHICQLQISPLHTLLRTVLLSYDRKSVRFDVK